MNEKLSISKNDDLKKSCYHLLQWYKQLGVDGGPVPIFPSMPVVNANLSFSKEEALVNLCLEMQSFQGCPLSKTAQNTVFSDGNSDSQIMLVGEAPGAEEDLQGKPFVGMSGKLLDNMLGAINLDRKSVYISNIVPWRPAFNRQPTLEEIAVCLPFIERHISIIMPKVLVCIGGVACKSLLRSNDTIASLQGKPLLYTSSYLSKPIQTFAIYHPAYLLRSPSQKRVAWQQLLKIKAFLELNDFLQLTIVK